MTRVRLIVDGSPGGDAVPVASPRLTWRVEEAPAGWAQERVQIRSEDETVVLDGSESVLVAWPFRPLAPGESREVAVAVHSAAGEVADSEPIVVAAAFLADGAWVARPIGLPDPDRPAQPVRMRTIVTVDRLPRRAVLFWTALGVAEPLVNGRAVSGDVLAPGWTSYRDRVVHETVDVTGLLDVGENVLAATLAGGWFTERYGFREQARRVYGDQPRFLAQLHLTFDDGEESVIATDGAWRVSGGGPLVASGIYAGEHHDARLDGDGWALPGFDDNAWKTALVADDLVPVPTARSAAPVRRIQTLPVQEVVEAPDGSRILDFGQNLVGRLRVRVQGPAGTRLVLRHAEVLEDGALARRPLRAAEATDVYVLSGDPDGEEWEPRFTFHGFRFAQVDGWPGTFDPTAVEAVVLHNDLERTGWFSSSEPLLDRLHENVVWGMRGNFLALPTDCPQRDERLGWTGDIQIFAPTASYLFDCSAFLRGWLRDLAAEQARADGVVPVVVPDVLDGFTELGPVAAWGDAATIVPWVLWERFGDRGVLADQFPSMKAWVDRVLADSRDGLWVGTMQLGDWLDPSAPPERPMDARTDSDIVASAYLARSLRIVADTAEVLGDPESAERYGALAEFSRAAFETTYVTPAGRMTSDAPTAYALALRFDLVLDPQLRARLAARLADLVRADGYRIGTGFVGTPLVADALAEGGHLARAERLLLQTECPSWLYPITMGATTVWERWDSMLPDGSINPGEMTSFNHYALGAVADWLHRTVAGLAPAEPGYRRLRIAPRPLDALDHAATRHLTPYGTAAVSWRREGDSLVVEAEVPPNTVADVVLPGRPAFEVASGTHSWRVSAPPAAVPTTPVGGFGLDSPAGVVLDHPEAYRALIDTLGSVAPELLGPVRDGTRWTDGRTIRHALLFAGPDVRAAVDTALARVGA